MTTTYRVSTLDVWGNQADGYEINNYFPAGSITVQDGALHGDIWDAMCEQGPAKGPYARAEFNDDQSGFIEICDARDGMPIFHLEADDES